DEACLVSSVNGGMPKCKVGEPRQHSGFPLVLDIIFHAVCCSRQRFLSSTVGRVSISTTMVHAKIMVTGALHMSSAFLVSLEAHSRTSSAVTNTCQDLDTGLDG